MIRAGFAVMVGAIFLAGAVAESQTSPQAPAPRSVSAEAENATAARPGGTAVNAELNSSLDSRKAKAGDKVEAHTTEAIEYGGKTRVPKGAKLEGHVIEATARSKGDSGSTLAIQFDKAIPKKGEEIPLTAAIVAIGAPERDVYGGSPGPGSDPMSGAGASAAGGSPMGAGRPEAPATPSYPSRGPVVAPNGPSQLPATSRGVYGLSDLKLTAGSPNAGQTTVIVSSGKSVHLDGGTRLLLLVETEAASSQSK